MISMFYVVVNKKNQQVQSQMSKSDQNTMETTYIL